MYKASSPASIRYSGQCRRMLLSDFMLRSDRLFLSGAASPVFTSMCLDQPVHRPVVSRHKYDMPLMSRNIRWRTLTRRRSTRSQTVHRATTPGHLMYKRASAKHLVADRKSTRLNSSHGYISYAVFCLKKKNNHRETPSVHPNTTITTPTYLSSSAGDTTADAVPPSSRTD